MKKIAIIGASYLQVPLIKRAKEKGYETHVFAWKVGDEGEFLADYFYPISIVEKDEILAKCIEIGIDGICTIASDLAVITVNHVASVMGLIGNSLMTTLKSTDKHAMRQCFEENGDPSPKSIEVKEVNESVVEAIQSDMSFPLIVKPVDRSGSRGITLVNNVTQLKDAIDVAKSHGFRKVAVVEEFVTGQEYSVEYVSWEGKHSFLALTRKYTTGAPTFIETAHVEPGSRDVELIDRIKSVVEHALDSLGVEYGASHSEIKVDKDGFIKIIEIGSRMGGDNIGSSLVQLTTGFDFVGAVIDIAMGIEPEVDISEKGAAAIRFVFNSEDLVVLQNIKKFDQELLVEEKVENITDIPVTDSSSRFGYYLIRSCEIDKIIPYMPY